MEKRLVDLESRLAFQEDAIQALNLTTTRQQRRIEELEAEIEALKTQIRHMAMSASAVADRSEESPPPHY